MTVRISKKPFRQKDKVSIVPIEERQAQDRDCSALIIARGPGRVRASEPRRIRACS